MSIVQIYNCDTICIKTGSHQKSTIVKRSNGIISIDNHKYKGTDVLPLLSIDDTYNKKQHKVQFNYIQVNLAINSGHVLVCDLTKNVVCGAATI